MANRLALLPLVRYRRAKPKRKLQVAYKRAVSDMDEKESLRKVLIEIQKKIEWEKFGGPSSIKFPIGPGVARVIWNAIHFRPSTETFHEFIINVLKWTVGQKWYEMQLQLQPEERHVIMKWCHAFSIATQRHEPHNRQPGQVYTMPLTGELKELLVLADDVYRLQLVRKLPRRVIQRLRMYEAFQGARYEIAIAATFVRCGFEIEWIEVKGKKHCEFIATHKTSGEVIAVETKSRHRPGMLNRSGDVPDPSSLRADVQSLLNQALEQNPGDRPFAIFIDVNLPHESEKDWPQKKWVGEIRQILGQYPTATLAEPSPYTFTVFTNFAWHYEGTHKAAGTEAILIINNPPRFPLKDHRTFEALVRSLDSYGVISNDE
jgi:hypothetical protein